MSSLPKDDFSKCYDCTWGPLKSLFLEFRCTSLVWIEFLQKSVRTVILKSKRSEDLNQGILDLTRRKFGCLLSNIRRFSKTQIHAYNFFQKKNSEVIFSKTRSSRQGFVSSFQRFYFAKFLILGNWIQFVDKRSSFLAGNWDNNCKFCNLFHILQVNITFQDAKSKALMIKEICSLLNLHFKASLLKKFVYHMMYQRGKFRFSVTSNSYIFAKQAIQQFELNCSCYCMILTRGSYPSLLSFAFAPNSKCTVISFLQKFRPSCICLYNSNARDDSF